MRTVVAKEISVGRSSASLRLELLDGSRLEVALQDGGVTVDGRRVGTFEPGGSLDRAWRSLLGRAVSLEDGPLAQELADWSPPADLPEELAPAARAVDRAIEDALRDAGGGGNSAGLPTVHVGENVSVGDGEVVAGDLVVVQGDAEIAGRVLGDVTVLDGTLDVAEGGSVEGAVRLADAELIRNDGVVSGGVRRLVPNPTEREVREEVRGEVEDEMRREIREELRREARVDDGGDRRSGAGSFAPLRAVFRGVGGVVQNLAVIVLLTLAGAAVISLAGERVDVIADTARRTPGRSAAVGIATTILLLPIWVLGFVALLVTIIGIPVAIAWLPLFPLAVGLAALVGYLAVARNAGEWLADSGYPWTHWIRKSNTLLSMVGGLIGLLALFVAANVISMAPFLGWVGGLLIAAGCIVTLAATQVGLGAVILTRAGRRPEPWPDPAPDA